MKWLGADLIGRRPLGGDARMLGLDGLVLGLEGLVPLLFGRLRHLLVRSRADWNGLFDDRAQRLEAVRQVVAGQRGADGAHATADVDPDGSRNDRALGRDHRAHRGALAEMDIGHDRHVLVDERQPGHVVQLLQGGVFDRHATGPRLDRRALGLDELKVAHGFNSLFAKSTLAQVEAQLRSPSRTIKGKGSDRTARRQPKAGQEVKASAGK
jgi:hypothetical protein